MGNIALKKDHNSSTIRYILYNNVLQYHLSMYSVLGPYKQKL